MKSVGVSRFLVPILGLCFLIVSSSRSVADDGASSIAAGGIVMIREPRITMQMEVLRISETKVQVDYEFRNDTGRDITTQVAFPVPAYSSGLEYPSVERMGFDDFRLSVEGLSTTYKVEIKAILKGRDVSAILTEYNVDIASFGHTTETGQQHMTDIQRLSDEQRAQLLHSGLITKGPYSYDPAWKVQKKYHWQQTFPAHTVIHISHQYSPVLGSSNTIGDPSDYNPKRKEDAEFASLCPAPSLISTLKKLGTTDMGVASMSYVDFILTTANTWRTPIEDFTLIVERPRPTSRNPKESYVSFCWPGPVTRIDADHFSSHVANLIPREELKVGFITPY